MAGDRLLVIAAGLMEGDKPPPDHNTEYLRGMADLICLIEGLDATWVPKVSNAILALAGKTVAETSSARKTTRRRATA